MPAELLTIEDVMARLKVSRPTINRWMANRTIAFIKLPQGVRFREEWLENWLDKRTIKPVKKQAS